jgi:hypothetical protein
MLDDPQVQVKLGIREAVVELLGSPQTDGHPPGVPRQLNRVASLRVVRELGARRDVIGSTPDLIPKGDGDRVPRNSPGEIDLVEHLALRPPV